MESCLVLAKNLVISALMSKVRANIRSEIQLGGSLT